MRMTLASMMRLSVVGLMALTLGVTGCKTSGDRTTGQKRSDREVAKTVDKRLSQDPTYKYPNVHVSVYNGNIQLSGFADTPAQRKQAAELAAQTPGAKQVINGIMLSPMPTGRVPIRDPLGHNAGELMLNTNAPSPSGQ